MKLADIRSGEGGTSLHLAPTIVFSIIGSLAVICVTVGIILKTVNSNEVDAKQALSITHQNELAIAKISNLKEIIELQGQKTRDEIDNTTKWAVGIDDKLNRVAQDVAALKAVSTNANINLNKNER